MLAEDGIQFFYLLTKKGSFLVLGTIDIVHIEESCMDATGQLRGSRYGETHSLIRTTFSRVFAFVIDDCQGVLVLL